jgi:DNA-binding CsgD family transcriptional regulator
MLPDFLNRLNKEFVNVDGEPFQIKIELVPFSEADDETRLQLQLNLTRDLVAQGALHHLGITDPEERLRKFVFCRYGGFDDQADIEGDKFHPEYFDCGKRGNCPVEGRLCHHIKAANGFLTPREIEIIKLISQDLADKEIADKLGISFHTASTHIVNIRKKLNAFTKVGIATFAVQKNIT